MNKDLKSRGVDIFAWRKCSCVSCVQWHGCPRVARVTLCSVNIVAWLVHGDVVVVQLTLFSRGVVNAASGPKIGVKFPTRCG